MIDGVSGLTKSGSGELTLSQRVRRDALLTPPKWRPGLGSEIDAETL